MQAVIPAAGMAVRMRPLSYHTHKCLFKIGEKPIIHYVFRNLEKCGIKDVVLVLGYKAETLKSYLLEHFPGFTLGFAMNDRYDSTNNAYSLWLAEPLVRGAFVLMDSDILFDYRILDAMMNGSGPARLAVHFRKDIGAEEVKVRLDSSGRVVEIGKDIDPLLAVGESIGIERFSREWRDALFATLSDQIERRGLTNQFYESAFQELMDDGMEMRATDTAGFPCMELDTPEDLRRAEDDVLPLLSWD